jgi:hypothetical protein
MLTASFMLYLTVMIDDRITIYLLCIIVLFLIYFVLTGLSIVRPERFRFPLKYILSAAVLFRVVLFPAAPILSPDAAHPVFSVAQLTLPENIMPQVNPIAGKILLLIAESVVTLLLIRLLDHFKIHRTRLIIFTLNPLLITETYQNGHTEVLGVLLMVAGVWYFFSSRQIRSVIFFTIAGLIKIIPALLMIPVLLKNFRKSFFTMACILLAAAAFSPGGTLSLSGFLLDTKVTVFKGGLYWLITDLMEIVGVGLRDLFGTTQTIMHTDPQTFYRIFAIFILVLVIIDQLRKLYRTASFTGINYLQAGFMIMAAFFLLSPVLYPWHLIWLLPLLVFAPRWSWIAFFLLIQFSYAMMTGAGRQMSQLLVLAQYVSFYGLLIWEYLDRRRIKV